jgi:hypothetical protein
MNSIDALIVIVFLFIAGCASNPKIVYVPVEKPCVSPQLPQQNVYPISSLSSVSTPADVVKAYVSTVQMQQDYISICTRGNK